MRSASDLRRDLSALVLKDPQAARADLQKAIKADFVVVEAMMELLTESGDKRLRQLVANVARTHDGSQRFVPHLLRWRERETDEFTRRAINAALSGIVQINTATLAEPSGRDEVLPELFQAFGFVAARLKHRIRNAMLPAQANLAKLRGILDANEIREATPVIAKLVDALRSIGRELEATEVDPAHFEDRSIDLVAWLKEMNADYKVTYPNSSVTLTLSSDRSVIIRGSDYLLQTLFWNLWLDAQQNVDSPCRIYVEIVRRNGTVELTILDNGDGFPITMKDVAFQVGYSSQSASRGSGLLEAADAVNRLGGSIRLARRRQNDFRITITLPTRGSA